MFEATTVLNDFLRKHMMITCTYIDFRVTPRISAEKIALHVWCSEENEKTNIIFCGDTSVFWTNEASVN